MRYAELTVDRAIATVRMQDQARRNALSSGMLEGLTTAFRSVGAEIRAVVLRASVGDQVWCAGFDIAALGSGIDPLAPGGPLQALFSAIEACAAPVIGMLHGSAWGGGADLALRCDLLTADPTASLAFTPGRLGLPYDEDGLLNAMTRAGRALAMEMFATAMPVGAERAWQAGLLSLLVPEEELEAATYRLAGRIAENAPLTIASAKAYLRALSRGALAPDQRAKLEAGRRAALHSADYVDGLAAFREKRRPVFRGG